MFPRRAPIRRVLWIVNHKTLLSAEVPVLRSLGFEVFIPKIIPIGSSYRSGVVSFEYDSALTIPSDALAALNSHDFYKNEWPDELTQILNEYFEILITSLSEYMVPLFEALHKFQGLTIARVFGREEPRNYSELFQSSAGIRARAAIKRAGARFVFCQAYDHLADVEDDFLRRRARTVTVPVPRPIWDERGTWVGSETRCLFLCPNILDADYYGIIYRLFKRHFGDLPHVIFGKQVIPVEDTCVLPYLSDGELYELYRRMAVFLYPSTEPRHVHYSPIEAMIIGTPVLFLRDNLLSRLSHQEHAGCCDSLDEMKEKALRLLEADEVLLRQIKKGQDQIVESFSMGLARRQWAGLFKEARLDSRGSFRKGIDFLHFSFKWEWRRPRRRGSSGEIKLPLPEEALRDQAADVDRPLALLSAGEFAPGVIDHHFSEAETDGRWTLGPAAGISFVLDRERWPHGVVLEVTGWRFAVNDQMARVSIRIDEAEATPLVFSNSDWTSFALPISPGLSRRRVVRCVWIIENPLSPRGYEMNPVRKLGMFVGALTLRPAQHK